MTKAMVRKALLALPVQDRLDLIDELQVSIARDREPMRLDEGEKSDLRKLVADYRSNPEGNLSQGEMKKRLSGLRRRFAARVRSA
jgi:putative addiction module component (TIGR02574 family)